MLELVGLASVTEERTVELRGAIVSESTLSASLTVSSPQNLLDEREAARAAKDFVRADEIRDELAVLGYEVRDSADGPRLVPKA